MGITVAIVDEDQAIREANAEFLRKSEKIDLVHLFADAESALAGLTAEPVDVAVLETRLPGRDGLALAVDLHSQSPGTKIVFVTNCDDDRCLRFATKHGHGLVLKPVSPAGLEQVIVTIDCGLVLVSNRLARRLAPAKRKIEDVVKLTKAEVEVMNAVSLGLTNRQVAKRLYCSEDTVKTHLKNIYRKMGVRTRSQAVLRFLP